MGPTQRQEQPGAVAALPCIILDRSVLLPTSVARFRIGKEASARNLAILELLASTQREELIVAVLPSLKAPASTADGGLGAEEEDAEEDRVHATTYPTFGAPLGAGVDLAHPTTLPAVATAARVLQLARNLVSGHWVLVLEGLCRVRVERQLPPNPSHALPPSAHDALIVAVTQLEASASPTLLPIGSGWGPAGSAAAAGAAGGAAVPGSTGYRGAGHAGTQPHQQQHHASDMASNGTGWVPGTGTGTNANAQATAAPATASGGAAAAGQVPPGTGTGAGAPHPFPQAPEGPRVTELGRQLRSTTRTLLRLLSRQTGLPPLKRVVDAVESAPAAKAADVVAAALATTPQERAAVLVALDPEVRVLLALGMARRALDALRAANAGGSVPGTNVGPGAITGFPGARDMTGAGGGPPRGVPLNRGRQPWGPKGQGPPGKPGDTPPSWTNGNSGGPPWDVGGNGGGPGGPGGDGGFGAGPEGGDGDEELAGLMAKLAAAQPPPEVLKVAAKEYRRLKQSGDAQPGAAASRAFLEVLSELPWSTTTAQLQAQEAAVQAAQAQAQGGAGPVGPGMPNAPAGAAGPGAGAGVVAAGSGVVTASGTPVVPRGASSLKEARAVLDAAHYGLDKVKDRVVEHLAVLRLRGAAAGRAPILCFIGPPGVGKTSLARAVATVLGRPFVRIALGGVRDEAEIRGHRRTYVGAMPGRIIQGLRRAGVRDPVMLLDEVDKLGRDALRGDPAAALLEVLDPEQNAHFTDAYLALPFDLSGVTFVATANRAADIPGPLLDRLEVITLPGYTLEEKVHIGCTHLVQRAVADTGLRPGQLELAPSAMAMLVDRYTREAGVRGLARAIAALARHVAVRTVTAQDQAQADATATAGSRLLAGGSGGSNGGGAAGGGVGGSGPAPSGPPPASASAAAAAAAGAFADAAEYTGQQPQLRRKQLQQQHWQPPLSSASSLAEIVEAPLSRGAHHQVPAPPVAPASARSRAAALLPFVGSRGKEHASGPAASLLASHPMGPGFAALLCAGPASAAGVPSAASPAAAGLSQQQVQLLVPSGAPGWQIVRAAPAALLLPCSSAKPASNSSGGGFAQALLRPWAFWGGSSSSKPQAQVQTAQQQQQQAGVWYGPSEWNSTVGGSSISGGSDAASEDADGTPSPEQQQPQPPGPAGRGPPNPLLATVTASPLAVLPAPQPVVPLAVVSVDEALMEEVLGPPRFGGTDEAAERVAGPGAVAGLVWTAVGGGVQYVEAARISEGHPGRPGTLTLTGQVGEVLEESARIALSWVRAHARELGLMGPAPAPAPSPTHPTAMGARGSSSGGGGGSSPRAPPPGQVPLDMGAGLLAAAAGAGAGGCGGAAVGAGSGTGGGTATAAMPLYDGSTSPAHSWDIHVHLPAGAIPKDGPSAGITIATALVSLLSGRPVRADTAMTGELSLRGLVLPVGGIKEKLLAARHAGLTRVIVPARNMRDVTADVPAGLRQTLTVLPVGNLPAALAAAFDPPFMLQGAAQAAQSQL